MESSLGLKKEENSTSRPKKAANKIVPNLYLATETEMPMIDTRPESPP